MEEDLQFLTEKDLEYFKRLQETGEALILTISDEDLLSLDFSVPEEKEKPENEGEIISQAELTAWVKEHRAEFSKRADENRKIQKENESLREEIDAVGEIKEENEITDAPSPKREKPASSLTERLMEVHLDEKQADIINQAILAGLDEQLILMLLDGNLSAEEMRKLLEVFAGDD